MKKTMGRLLSGAVMTTMLLLPISPTMALAAEAYTDVPEASWAKEAVYQAQEYGLMSGQGDSLFGYGASITKAEFATMLCNMLDWKTVSVSGQSFGDVPADKWYYSYIETALANGAVDKAAAFLPDAPITREQMAVMFVRALGLGDAARIAESSPLPFTDVTGNKGYITVARDIGMINGISQTAFGPANTAKREEAAAMLTRVYQKYYGKTDFLHGFYAISAYSQKELAAEMDAVTLGWSSMTADAGGVQLITGEGQYKIADSYELVTSYLDENQVKAHLGVYMDSTQGVKDLLLSQEKRGLAVDAIMAELGRTYTEIGKNPYSGVTIDFEGLKGADVKQGLNSFLTELSGKLKSAGKTLYVAVQPVLPGGAYFDGFDYRTIGNLADKVILMAHDYNPTSLAGYEGTQWHNNTAPTPIGQVYYSIKAATDRDTGVADKSKLALAISFATVGWELTDDGKLLSTTPVFADSKAVNAFLAKPQTVRGFSKTYRNPYITYQSDSGKNMFLWYENEQSVFEKAALARLFDVDGVSLWRLGNIPAYSGYDVMDSVK